MSLEHRPLAPPPEQPPMQSPVKQRPHPLKRLGGLLVGAALLVWKLFAPLLLILKNVKFFWAGLTFFVSVAAYTTIWSWRFALGFTVLLLIHEMGHVIQLRREGVPASAPLFIPFLGAVVGMKGLPQERMGGGEGWARRPGARHRRRRGLPRRWPLRWTATCCVRWPTPGSC